MCKEPIDLDKRTQCIGWLWWNESNTYFSIRAAISFVCVATSIYSFTWYAVPFADTVYDETKCCEQYYWLYFTHYALLTETVYFLLMLYLHGQCLYNSSFDVHSRCNIVLFHLMKAFYCVGLSATVLIGIVYWPLFYSGNTGASYLALQVLQHSITPFLFFVEYFINLNQLKFKYVAWVLLFSTLYCAMQLVFWLTDATAEDGSSYIYAALDFDGNTSQAALLLAVCFIAAPIMYLILCALDIYIMRYLDDEKLDTRAGADHDAGQTAAIPYVMAYGGGYDPSAAMQGQHKDQEFEYKWKINLDFDPKTEQIYLRVVEELSKRKWSLTLGKEDVNGKIRDEYNRLGKAIANGVCEYVYPEDSGAAKVSIKYNNDEFNFSVPQDY